MSENTEGPTVHRGLKDVYFERSPIAYIDGRAGELRYRGYSIHDLAEHSSFEETAYLLLHDELPTAAALAAFREALVAGRTLPGAIHDLIRGLAGAHPMTVLRTAVSALGALEGGPGNAETRETILAKGIRLTAQVPAIVAAHRRIREGAEPVTPDPGLGHAANFLYMLTGRRADAEAARLIDTDLILHAEHGANASAFAARVVAGTEADLHGALTAALAALAGPAHGGAAENVMRMAEEIGDPAKAAEYVRRKRRDREPIMGFGHRVYRAEDPGRGTCAPGSSGSRGRWASPAGTASSRPWSRPCAPTPATGQRQRRLLCRGRLPPLGHPGGPLRRPLRHRPNPGVDGTGARAACQQHPDPPASRLYRAGAAPLCPDRAALKRLRPFRRVASPLCSISGADR